MILMDTKQVKELTGLTDNQITYLIKKVDALKREKTQGKAREYTFRELVYLKLASLMRSDGLRLPVINEAIESLNVYWTNDAPEDAGTLLIISNAKIWIDDGDQPAGGGLVIMYSQSDTSDDVLGDAKQYMIDGRLPGAFYNVRAIASELSKLDQLELGLMSEVEAVH